MNLGRRAFLKLVGTTAAVVVIPPSVIAAARVLPSPAKPAAAHQFVRWVGPEFMEYGGWVGLAGEWKTAGGNTAFHAIRMRTDSPNVFSKSNERDAKELLRQWAEFGGLDRIDAKRKSNG